MKKFLKFLGSAALLCGTIAGGIFVYKKFFAPDPFDDDLEDESMEDAAEETAGRGYVSLGAIEETESDEDTEAAEEAAQTAETEDTVKEAASED